MGADVAEGAVGRGTEVDRRLAPAGRGRPARAEELLAGRDQVVGAAADPLGVEHQHVGLGGEQVDQQLHLVDQRRRQRLHALGGDAGGDLVGELDQLGVLLAELPRAPADLVGEQQLAARRRPQPVDRLVGALVGDREAADLLDVVAPELHPQRVLLGGREDVDDAAADRELAAPLDQVDAGVRRVGQPLHDVLHRRGLAGHQLDRLEVAEPLDLRLQHRADRGDDDLERAVVRVGVGQPAQDREPAADGVAARAEPLVRQRLPARVERDGVGVEQRTELLDEVLGLADGGGDREHRAAGADQAVDHERTDRGRPGEVEGAHHAAAGIGDRLVEGGVGEDGVGQTRKGGSGE